MKKIIYSLILILGLFVIPGSVLAESCTSAITGNKEVKVGETTTVYVKVDASNAIKGADINFEVSGNIGLVSASPVGLNTMAQNGNRYILYSNNGVNAGSNIFAIKVKGTAKGTGTVKVSSLETTISDETVICSLTSATINVKEVEKKTTTNTNTVKPVTPKEEEKKEEVKEETKPVEPVKTQEEIDYEKALELVKKAEKTKKKDDVNKAKEAIDKLKFSEKKYDLIERLFNITIELDDTGSTKTKTNDMTKLSTDVTGGMSWFFLAVILLICLATETIYLMAKEVKKKNEA